MGHNGPNNIGTHAEDVPRSLNADMGGEGSPTDRLWQRYRTELANARATAVTGLSAGVTALSATVTGLSGVALLLQRTASGRG